MSSLGWYGCSARTRTISGDQVRCEGDCAARAVGVLQGREPKGVAGQFGCHIWRAARRCALGGNVESNGACRIGCRRREREMAGPLLIVFGDLGRAVMKLVPLAGRQL